MTSYRLYRLNAAGGIRGSQELEYENDDQAIDHAAAIDYPHGLELWSDNRLIWRFPDRILYRDLVARRLPGPPQETRSVGSPPMNWHHQARTWLNKLLHHPS